MSLEFMLQEMLQQIRVRGGAETHVDAYLTEWRSAIKRYFMKDWIPVLIAICSVIIIFALVIVTVARLTN